MTWRPGDPDPYLDLSDGARLAEQVAARRERRDRLERASEVATWEGTLEDLVERQPVVSLRLAGGRSRRGRLVGLGRDHLAIRAASGQLALVRVAAVRSLRPEPGEPAPVATGDRARSSGRLMLEVLDEALVERERLVAILADVPDPVTGLLLGVGEDVLTLRLDAAADGVLYLPVGAITELVLDG